MTFISHSGALFLAASTISTFTDFKATIYIYYFLNFQQVANHVDKWEIEKNEEKASDMVLRSMALVGKHAVSKKRTWIDLQGDGHRWKFIESEENYLLFPVWLKSLLTTLRRPSSMWRPWWIRSRLRHRKWHPFWSSSGRLSIATCE